MACPTLGGAHAFTFAEPQTIQASTLTGSYSFDRFPRDPHDPLSDCAQPQVTIVILCECSDFRLGESLFNTEQFKPPVAPAAHAMFSKIYPYGACAVPKQRKHW